MTVNLPATALRALPAPYHAAEFRHRQHGIFDDAGVGVFVDNEASFAVLYPAPVLDYAKYVPRKTQLGLGEYKKRLSVIERRFAKIRDMFPEQGTVLEVGAADGSFLSMLREQRPTLQLVSVEPDQNTRAARAALRLQGDHAELADAIAAGVAADVICFFHVFEHIAAPAAFLEQMRRLLAPRGRIIIEVPSLDDPLLSLYRVPAYERFYFQKQHPYVYSARSLTRVLEAHGWRVAEARLYQRYGLENHLSWLISGKPGGDARLAEAFAGIEDGYRQAIEATGLTDTIFVIAQST